MDSRDVHIPEEFRQVPLDYFGVNFGRGREILRYCQTCTKKGGCDMNLALRDAMGNDYPYWSESFIGVDVSLFGTPRVPDVRVFCAEYSSLSKPNNLSEGFCDGVIKLIDILKQEQS